MSFEIERIMEDLIEDGLPQELVGKIEQIIINEHAKAVEWEKKYEKEYQIRSWTENPDRMGF